MSFLPIFDYGVIPATTSFKSDGNPSGSDVSNTAAISSASAGSSKPPSGANPGGKGATAGGEGGTAGAGGAKADGAEAPKKKATKLGSSGAGGKKAAGKAAAKGKGKAGTGKGAGKAAGTGSSSSAAGAAAAAREKEERMKAAKAEVEAHATALEAHRSAVFKLQALLIRDDLQGVLDAAGVGRGVEVREWVGGAAVAGVTSSEGAGTGVTGTGADAAATDGLSSSGGFESAVHNAIEGYIPRHGTEAVNKGFFSQHGTARSMLVEGEGGKERGVRREERVGEGEGENVGERGGERGREKGGERGRGDNIAQSIMSQVVAASGTCDEVFAPSVGMEGWVGGEQNENGRGGMGVGVGDRVGGTLDVAAAEAGGTGGAGDGAGANGTAAAVTATGKEAVEGRPAELRPALKKAVSGEKGGREVGAQREEGRHVTWAADDRLAVAQDEKGGSGSGGRGRGEGELEGGSAGREERWGEGSAAGERGGKERGGGRGKKQGAVREGAVREGSSGVVGRGAEGMGEREGWGVEGGAEAAAAGRCGWFEPPPPGFKMQLPFHCTLLMALQEWVTADSLRLIYPPPPPPPPPSQQPQTPAQAPQSAQPPQQPSQPPCVISSVEANGWEYPALLGSVPDAARAAEIRRTLGEGLGRETAGVVEGLGLLLPLSTVEHTLTRLLATFAFRSPLASLRRPHWQLLLLLLLEALSVNCLPPAAASALNTHRHQVYKVAAAAGVDRDNYLLLRQMLLPRGPSVSNPNQNTNAAA
ncbi:unnamed protein product [Closterium sp. Naga37s-1]|nr:unnamed protein product [Closterium sp. Naga37s-1]